MLGLVFPLTLATAAMASAQQPEPPDPPGKIIERALEAIGTPSEIAALGGLTFEAEGTRNQAAERQGRAPFSVDFVPFRERMAWDPQADRLAREYRYDRYDGTFEWLRDIYESGVDRKILVLQDGFAVWLRSPDHADERRRFERRIPHLLLAEVLRQSDRLTTVSLGTESVSIRGALEDGTQLTVEFQAESYLPLRLEYQADLQSWGDAALTWSFAEWKPLADAGRFPGRILAEVSGQPFLDVRVTRVATGPAAIQDLFTLPRGMTLPDRPRTLSPSADRSAGARVRQEAPGIYTVRNLRPGFHPLFVEMGDCVLSVDAPAGYRLLEQLPAGDVAEGPTSSWLSERYIELIKETLPDKRICWVALTHFHNDHAGGLRAFVAEGATLLVSPGDRLAVQQLIENPHRLAPDRLSRSPRKASIQVVDGRLALEAGGREVEVLQIGVNPHSDEMLLVNLPQERMLFVSDLLTPAPLEEFPTPSHAALDRWFADWLTAAGFDPDRVYAMHGSGLATRGHLAKLRDQHREPRLVWLATDQPLVGAASELPHVEPHLAAHAEDPKRLVAASIVVSPTPDRAWHCAAFSSSDAGRSWQRHDFPMERCIDPWVLITEQGEVFVAAIEIKRDRPQDDRFRLLLFRSGDGGLSWGAPLDLGRAHDHEMLLQEPSGKLLLVSRRSGRTEEGHLRRSVGIMGSDDGGRSFGGVNNVVISNLNLSPTGLVRLSDGTLVVSLIDFQRNVDGFDVRGGLAQPRAWALRSRDGGKSFSEPLFLSEGCGAAEGFTGYPALAVDTSQGPFRDRLYHLCIRADFEGVSLATSDSAGETWSDPRRIDAPPADGAAHVRTPMVAVNRDGVVAVAWYDRRNDPERRCQDLYMTFSTDGAVTFQPPVRVSSETSCPETVGNGRVARSWPMGGDYGSLTAAADGAFHVLWADSRRGHFQLHHAAFRVGRSSRLRPAQGDK